MAVNVIQSFFLLDFPDEILLDRILRFLPKTHIGYARVSQVCKRFNGLIKETWKSFFFDTNHFARAWILEVQAEKRTWKWLASAIYHYVHPISSSPSFEIGWRNVTTEIRLPEDDDWEVSYTGEFKGGRPCGFGFLHYTNDVVEAGYFKGGYRVTGHGRRWENGRLVFSGIFNEEGHPKYGERPQVYVPLRRRGVPEQEPPSAYSGSAYIGSVNKYAVPYGHGAFYDHTGTHYYGAVREGIPNGYGRRVGTDGVICEGTLLIFHCPVCLIHVEGIFKHGEFDTGKEIHPNGFICTGQMYILPSGRWTIVRGLLNYPSGCTYFGDLNTEGGNIVYAVHERADGPGIFTWPDGVTFIGKFKHGRRFRGMLHLPGGACQHQDWEGHEEAAVLFNVEDPKALPSKELPASKKRKANND